MFPNAVSYRTTPRLLLLFGPFCPTFACGNAVLAHAQSVPLTTSNQALPINVERHIDDLDQMEKRQTIHQASSCTAAPDSST